MLTRWLGSRAVLSALGLLVLVGTAVVVPRAHETSHSVESIADPALEAPSSTASSLESASKAVVIDGKSTTAAPGTSGTDASTSESTGALTPSESKPRGGSSTTRPAGTSPAPKPAAPPTTAPFVPPPPPPPTTAPPSAVPNGLPAALVPIAWNVRDILGPDVSLGLPPGWGLDHFEPEVQRYRDKGVTIRSDGLISLDARMNDPDSPTGFTSGSFTSGWLSSQQKVHRGDYVQAAMKLPGGSGMWPALWLLDVPTPDAARTHEIDIMEAVGREPGIVYHTIHFNGQQKQHSTKLDYTQWHTYGVYLGADATYFYVDGNMVGTTDAAPANIQYGVKANLALGGSWAGDPDPAAFPAQVLMTPVRVWSPA